MQFELPWALGPPDGRYLLREQADGEATHVLVLATLGAPERRRLGGRRARAVAPEPQPAAVTTGRATVIDAQPVAGGEAARWLEQVDVATAEAAFAAVVRAVRTHRIASGDVDVHPPALAQALVVRVGYGAGEQVAEGRWASARELPAARAPRRRRVAALQPQERLAALLGGRSHALACEELTLRARHDLDHGQLREGALQLRTALDAALRELAREEPRSAAFAERLEELEARRAALDPLADAAIGGLLPPAAAEQLDETLGRLEAALRARAAGEA
ncbi:MAG TPA: hypothetical protein VE972_09135 [Conexibacter sp.]|nr:hypothetical protein [Conexibacter sp.]